MYIYGLAYQGRLRTKKEPNRASGAERYVVRADLLRFMEERAKWAADAAVGVPGTLTTPTPFAMLDVSEVRTIAGKPDLLLLRHDIFMLKQTIENLISHIEQRQSTL